MPKLTIAEQEIYYREAGTGDTLLMFPDNLHSSLVYQEEMSYYSSKFHVLSFDYPGSGKSTIEVKNQDEREYDLWNYYADFACHLLLALKIDKCHVMGAGEGALVALHFAGNQAKLHGLTALSVIADSFLCKYDGRALHRLLNIREHYYVRHAGELQQQHGDSWRQIVDADTAFLRGVADRGGYELPDFVMNSIACPVLLTGNLRDAVTPGISQEFARASAIIPDCSVYLTSKSGHRYGDEHPFMWTAPTLFRAISDLFLSRVMGNQ